MKFTKLAPLPAPCCAECHHWRTVFPVPGGIRAKLGDCRKHAPAADHIGRSLWPTTLACDRCGDFVRKAGGQ